jgi:hypothetical protein
MTIRTGFFFYAIKTTLVLFHISTAIQEVGWVIGAFRGLVASFTTLGSSQ